MALETVYAIHSFSAEKDDEISFEYGEPILVFEKDDMYGDGWWQGKNIYGEIGLFPMNYTSYSKPLPQSPKLHKYEQYSKSTNHANNNNNNNDIRSNNSKRINNTKSYRVSENQYNQSVDETIDKTIDDIHSKLGEMILKNREEDYGGRKGKYDETEENEDDDGFLLSNANINNHNNNKYYNNNKYNKYKNNNKLIPNGLSLSTTSVSTNKLLSPKGTTPMYSQNQYQLSKKKVSTSKKSKNHPITWDVERVRLWLQEKGFDSTIQKNFLDNDIAGDILLGLNIKTLKELNIVSFGKRVHIMNAIMELKSEFSMNGKIEKSDSSDNDEEIPNSPRSPVNKKDPHSMRLAIDQKSQPISSLNFGNRKFSMSSPSLPKYSKNEDDIDIIYERFQDLSSRSHTTNNKLKFSTNSKNVSYLHQVTLQRSESDDIDNENNDEKDNRSQKSFLKKMSQLTKSNNNNKKSQKSLSMFSPQKKKEKPRTTSTGVWNFESDRDRHESYDDNNNNSNSNKISPQSRLISSDNNKNEKKSSKHSPNNSSNSNNNNNNSKSKKYAIDRNTGGGGSGGGDGLGITTSPPTSPKFYFGYNRFKNTNKINNNNEDYDNYNYIMNYNNNNKDDNDDDVNNNNININSDGNGDPDQDILDSIGTPDYEGFLKKQCDKYKVWKTRLCILKGVDLYYLKKDTASNSNKLKGQINLTNYRIIPDENLLPGKYGFKLVHETSETHYFAHDDQLQIKEWVKAIMKTTISRDAKAPVMSSNSIVTMPLDEARRMAPRPPPSPSSFSTFSASQQSRIPPSINKQLSPKISSPTLGPESPPLSARSISPPPSLLPRSSLTSTSSPSPPLPQPKSTTLIIQHNDNNNNNNNNNNNESLSLPSEPANNKSHHLNYVRNFYDYSSMEPLYNISNANDYKSPTMSYYI